MVRKWASNTLAVRRAFVGAVLRGQYGCNELPPRERVIADLRVPMNDGQGSDFPDPRADSTTRRALDLGELQGPGRRVTVSVCAGCRERPARRPSAWPTDAHVATSKTRDALRASPAFARAGALTPLVAWPPMSRQQRRGLSTPAAESLLLNARAVTPPPAAALMPVGAKARVASRGSPRPETRDQAASACVRPTQA